MTGVRSSMATASAISPDDDPVDPVGGGGGGGGDGGGFCCWSATFLLFAATVGLLADAGFLSLTLSLAISISGNNINCLILVLGMDGRTLHQIFDHSGIYIMYEWFRIFFCLVSSGLLIGISQRISIALQ